MADKKADETDFTTPIHPGEVLQAEFMVPLGLSANRIAAVLSVPANRISSLVKGDRNVTADTALRLADAFGTTPEFWMTLQDRYDLALARRRDRPLVHPLIDGADVTAAGIGGAS
jgi:addiction module HigA family antidote